MCHTAGDKLGISASNSLAVHSYTNSMPHHKILFHYTLGWLIWRVTGGAPCRASVGQQPRHHCYLLFHCYSKGVKINNNIKRRRQTKSSTIKVTHSQLATLCDEIESFLNLWVRLSGSLQRLLNAGDAEHLTMRLTSSNTLNQQLNRLLNVLLHWHKPTVLFIMLCTFWPENKNKMASNRKDAWPQLCVQAPLVSSCFNKLFEMNVRWSKTKKRYGVLLVYEKVLEVLMPFGIKYTCVFVIR